MEGKMQLTEGVPRELAIAIADYKAGRSAQALKLFNQLYWAYPDMAAPARALGTALCSEGDFAGAIEPLERSVTLEPTDAPSRAYLALALLLGRYEVESARLHMEHAVTSSPDSFVVRWKYGEFLLRLGYASEAAAELRAALRTDAPDSFSRFACADLLRLAEKQATGQYNRIAPRFPMPKMQVVFQRLLSWIAGRRAARGEA